MTSDMTFFILLYGSSVCLSIHLRYSDFTALHFHIIRSPVIIMIWTTCDSMNSRSAHSSEIVKLSAV